jgi:hypothetical protein
LKRHARPLLALATLVALLGFGVCPAAADLAEGMVVTYGKAIRQLDGRQFLEDEPIWLCEASQPGPAGPDAWAPPCCFLVARDPTGHRVGELRPARLTSDAAEDPTHLGRRGFEFVQTFGFVDASRRYPLWGHANGVPEGDWEIHGLGGDTARVLAVIRVIPPRGSERSVRDALARAARLVERLDRPREAAALYESIVQRYPRTAYLSAIYWGEWKVREHTRYARDPGRWMEEIFAKFHDTCFGVVALDRWVNDLGVENARPTLRTLVGLYPDTPLSRAAQRYVQVP